MSSIKFTAWPLASILISAAEDIAASRLEFIAQAAVFTHCINFKTFNYD